MVALVAIVLTAVAGTSALCPDAAVHPTGHTLVAAALPGDAPDAAHAAHAPHASHADIAEHADATPVAPAELPEGHAGVAHLVMSCLVLVALVAIRPRATGRPWSSALADAASALSDVRRAPEPPVPKPFLVPVLVAAR